MNSLVKKYETRYTVADYMSWPDDERLELIGGRIFDMSPAPTIKHQSITGEFYSQLKQKLKGKSCIPFIAPVDVVLSAKDVVQPDVLVVCDSAKITEKNIQGAPDLIVEVLSPRTALKDMREKKSLYERSGVREYVVIDPLEEYVQRFWLQIDGHYGASDIFGPSEVLALQSLPEVELPLWEIFGLEP
ncbi:MAG: Uma2 family endonuclease [Methylobacter sp.]|nr:Uma2 family endonuclease [Methylobacter sp.]